jgi:peptidoglycan/LPS O-acetylase OafA/YrhL
MTDLPKPPLAIRVAPVLLLLGGIYTLLALAVALFLPGASHAVDGVSIPHSTFLRLVAPLVFLGGVSSLVLGLGISRRRPWARRFALTAAVVMSGLTFLCLVLLGRSVSEVFVTYGWKLALGIALLHFVLYGRGSVRDHFDGLGREKRSECQS